MNWFFIALGAPFLWAMVNISDQYLVKKYSTGERGSGGLVLFSSLVGICAALAIFIFNPRVFNTPLLDILLLIVAGGLTIAWVILYLFTLEIEEISTVVPWFLTIPIFGYALGYIFLKETLSLQQILGSIVILFGVLVISIDFSKNKKKFKWKPAFYMLVACVLIATSGVIFKFVTIGNSFWISSFWEYLGLGGFGILIYMFVPKYRIEFMLMNKQGGVKIFILNTISEIFTVGGNLLTNYAFLLAPVALVYLVSSFQPAIILFFTVIGTKFFPTLVTESFERNVFIPKIVAVIIMIFGSAILFL